MTGHSAGRVRTWIGAKRVSVIMSQHVCGSEERLIISLAFNSIGSLILINMVLYDTTKT